MNAIELTNVTKSFGQSNILNELSLAIPEGSLYGLIGENGAGKTTTMKLLLGLLPPDSGSIQLFNQEVTFGNTVTNQSVGYLPDVPQFYEYMTAREYLSFCGELTHINKAELSSRITNMLQNIGLDDTSKKIGGYSRGMKQRLGLAQALLNEPKLIICDEPTSALDPTGRHEFLELLSSLKRKSTILFSSHILSDVEQICDHVAILHNGTIQLSGEIKKLTQAKSHRYFIQFNSEKDCSSFNKVMEQNAITIKNDTKNTVTCSIDIDTIRSEQFILETLYKENILPNKLQRIEPSLEDVFLEVTTNEK